MDAHGNLAQRLLHKVRLGHGLQEVAAHHVEEVEMAGMGCLKHLARIHALPGRDRMAPELLEVPRIFLIHRQASRKAARHRAALGPSLHAAVASDGHQPAVLPPYHSASQRQVYHRAHVIYSPPLLGEPHAPDENSISYPGIEFRKAHDLGPGQTGLLFQHLPALRCQLRAQLGDSRGVLGEEAVVHPVPLQQNFQRTVEKSHIAARTDRKEIIPQAAAKQRALRYRRHPVTLQARLAVRIHHHDAGSILLGVIKVLGGHGLVVGQVGAEQDNHLGPDPIAVGTSGGAHADHLLERHGAGGVAKAGGVVNVVGAEQARQLLRHVIHFVRQAPRGGIKRNPPGVGGPESRSG